MKNYKYLFYSFLLSFFLIYINGQEIIKHKICTFNERSNFCQQIARTFELACKENYHGVDCMLNIQNKKAHIGRITPEEAYLGAPFLSEDVIVLGEVVNSLQPPSDTMVIVKKNISNGFMNLRGKKLCHPGYKHDAAFSRLILDELDTKIHNLDVNGFCATKGNTTLLEKKFESLSNLLGDSCRPGPWTQDVVLDKILKQKYSKMCNLCGPDKCDVDYKAPFTDSLKCLVENDADIAVTTFLEAQTFFSNGSNVLNYKYLCKDGIAASSLTPCSWTKQIPSLIVVDRSSAKEVRELLMDKLKSKVKQLLQSSSDESVEFSLINILNLKQEEVINLFPESEYKSLKDFVSVRREIPSVESNKKCGVTIKWCTRNAIEYQKCKWLSQAALNQGIQPVVECSLSSENNELSCLRDVQNNLSDLFVASADYGYVSFKKGLISIAYPETDSRNISTILAVIRSDDKSISSFKDFKGKSGCLPEFAGKEFLAFVDVARKLNVVPKTCDYGHLISDFVGSSCMPGARDTERGATDNTDIDKLCERCVPTIATQTAAYCNADNVNKYFGNLGALNCLNVNDGDFAVITKENFSPLNTNDFRVICKNNTLAYNNGLDVDSNCALNIITSSEVVVHKLNPKNPDIKLALREFEYFFNQNMHKAFQIFNVFNDTLDLLFKDSTPGLSFDSNDNEFIQNYQQLFADIACEQDNNNGAENAVALSATITGITSLVLSYILL